MSDSVSTVRNQYEVLPYPPRDPARELETLHKTWLEDLPKINHYCFAGKNDFQHAFRVLVAGGGTGDATIYLAEQLRHTQAHIVHLDLSTASVRIAQLRAAARGLNNISWINASLLDLPGMSLEHFDYINCSGVLHHLPEPDAGLVALKSHLKPDGALGIMVYGQYGRTAIYQMQPLLRMLTEESTPVTEKIETAKAVLGSLPSTNWFARAEDLHHDHKMGDAGIYDLLLHSQDRAYTVAELFDWIEDQHGLHIHFTDVYSGRSSYLPQMFLGNGSKSLLEKISRLPLRRQYAIAELMHGRLGMHSFYATTGSKSVAPYGEVDYIPFYFLDSVTGAQMEKVFNTNKNKGKTFVLRHEEAKIACQVHPGKYGPRILREIDGIKTFKMIFDIIRADTQYRFDYPTDIQLFADFRQCYEALNNVDRLFLKKCP